MRGGKMEMNKDKDFKVPGEEDPDFLREYGRAFVLINAAEFLLGIILKCQGINTVTKNLNCCRVPQEIDVDALGLGQKISEIEKLNKSEITLLGNEIIRKLWELNENRKKLAHNPVAQNVGTGSMNIIHKNDLHDLNELLEDTIEESRKLCNELMNAIRQRPEIAQYL